MKFVIDRDSFADAVAWTARSLPNRPSIPVLAGMLIEADKEGLTLSGFDYETSTRATLEAKVAAEGKALVVGRLLADITKSLPAKDVEVELNSTRIDVKCGSTRFSLQALPIDEYPKLPQMPVASGAVKAEHLSQAVSQAVSAAGRDDMLPLLTGVRLEFEGETMALMATDRFRASLRELAWFPKQGDMNGSALVPARVLNETAKSFSPGTDVTIAVASSDSGEGLIGFEGHVGSGTRRTTTRLLDGDFPPVRKLFQTKPETVAYVSTSEIIDAVKRVSLVAERNTPIRMTFSSGQVLLEAGTGEEAQATETLEAQVDGPDISIGFNPIYFLEGLSALTEPFVHLAFTQATKATPIAGAKEIGGEPNLDFRYLIMPVRLQN